jgi:beta-mannosidase
MKKIQKKNLSIQLNIKNPKLWWTHDLGTPFLYKLEILFLKNDEVIQRKKLKFGLRDIQLIKKKDNWGESFYFKLNGVPLFAKGANWIPIDSFIPRGKKEELYKRNLNDAKASNMNMLRVWGGGIYEDDKFYQLCDELGILLWQDFPFACAIYPYHQEFIDKVKQEAIENIVRLRNHPSLALWCGNNEIEYLWRILLINSNIKGKEKAYREGYLKLFEDILPKLVNKYDPQRNYWPSSPSNGFTKGKLGRINSNSPKKGDSHYWGVWHGGKSFSSYRRFNSRFMSEFGFESFPSIKTIKSFSTPDSFQINSKIMENHQKNPDGNDKILKYMKKRFNIPKDFQKKIILSQITQAEAIEYGVKHWRSKRNNFHCMGSLYWQLNDCWPVASWSSVDYFGRWKALHYFAKRFYQNIIGCVFEKRGNLKIYTVNDSLEPVELLFEYEIVNTKGNIVIQQNFSVKIPPLQSKLIEQKNLDIFDFNKDNKILIYRLIRKRDNKTIDHGYYLFKDPKEYDLMNPELKMSIEFKKKDSKDPQLEAIIKSKRISLFTYIYSNLVDFISSDNFFPMNSNETKSVLIKIKNYREEKERLENIKDSIYVKSLYDLVRS